MKRRQKKKKQSELENTIYGIFILAAIYFLLPLISKFSTPHFSPDTYVSHFYIHADQHTGVFHATLGSMPAPSWRAAKVIDRALAVAREAQRELKQPLEEDCTVFFQIADDKQLPPGMRVIISEELGDRQHSICSVTAQRILKDSDVFIESLVRETAAP